MVMFKIWNLYCPSIQTINVGSLKSPEKYVGRYNIGDTYLKLTYCLNTKDCHIQTHTWIEDRISWLVFAHVLSMIYVCNTH